jgi:hypothetical protein
MSKLQFSMIAQGCKATLGAGMIGAYQV